MDCNSELHWCGSAQGSPWSKGPIPPVRGKWPAGPKGVGTLSAKLTERSSSRQLRRRKSFGEFIPHRVGADDSVGPINVANLPKVSKKMLHSAGGQRRPPLHPNTQMPADSPKICVKYGTPYRTTSPSRRTAEPPPLKGEAWVQADSVCLSCRDLDVTSW